MPQTTPAPQINVSKIKAGGGIAGAIFTLLSVLIFLIGIPALRYFLPAAAILGLALALLMRLMRRETPGRPWILPVTTQPPAGSAIQPETTHRRPSGRLERRPLVSLPGCS